MSEPTKPFLLYTGPTPNARYWITPKFNVERIDISTNRQKEPWFIALKNGRIPVLVDRSRDNFVTFKAVAILIHLAHHCDTNNTFFFDAVTEPNNYSEMLQWIIFAAEAAPEDIPYAKKRYVEETQRLYGVVEIRLSQDRDWLAGPGRGKLSIADFNVAPWVRIPKFAEVKSLDEFSSVKASLGKTHLSGWNRSA
ncbi:hypothetical protein K438DRAFT_2017190, partial [Mycena galopus ATCC 62051]